MIKILNKDRQSDQLSEHSMQLFEEIKDDLKVATANAMKDFDPI